MTSKAKKHTENVLFTMVMVILLISLIGIVSTFADMIDSTKKLVDLNKQIELLQIKSIDTDADYYREVWTLDMAKESNSLKQEKDSLCESNWFAGQTNFVKAISFTVILALIIVFCFIILSLCIKFYFYRNKKSKSKKR